MARNPGTNINRSLRQLNSNLAKYKAEEMMDDFRALDPKDRLEFYLKMAKLLIDHQDLLKTDGQKKKENEVIITFFDINS